MKQAGRELDALIAEKVMGLIRVNTPGGLTVGWSIAKNVGASPLPYYSTSIGDAWCVVEKMNELNFYMKLSGKKNDWFCEITGFISQVHSVDNYRMFYTSATSVSLCICLAALQAMGEEE